MKFKVYEGRSDKVLVFDDADTEYKYPIKVKSIFSNKQGERLFNLWDTEKHRSIPVRVWRMLAYSAGIIPYILSPKTGPDGFSYVLREQDKGVVSGNIMVIKDCKIIGTC